MLCFLLAVAAPARAGTIEFVDVVRTSGGARPANEVRLRVIGQSGRVAEQNLSSQSGGTSSTQQQPNDTQSPSATQQGGSTDATLSQSGGTVEIIDLGDVTGTVCDCGVVGPTTTPKGGFPLWPLFALAAIPLAFIPGGEDFTPPGSPPPPTPTPPGTPVPEPATLLLFGSGLLALGARARRRYGRKALEAETLTKLAEEV